MQSLLDTHEKCKAQGVNCKCTSERFIYVYVQLYDICEIFLLLRRILYVLSHSTTSARAQLLLKTLFHSGFVDLLLLLKFNFFLFMLFLQCVDVP